LFAHINLQRRPIFKMSALSTFRSFWVVHHAPLLFRCVNDVMLM